MSTITQRGRIVVGVAASRSNQAALTLALQEAALRGSTLEVITAWQWDIDSDSLTLRQPFDVAGDAATAQEAAISRALAASTAPPNIVPRVLEGDPGTELCSSASHADLLFVGASQKNVLKRFLLGSVTQFCLQNATCPVVVVPEVCAPLGSQSGFPCPGVPLSRSSGKATVGGSTHP